MRFWWAILVSILGHVALYAWLIQPHPSQPRKITAIRPVQSAPLQVILLRRPQPTLTNQPHQTSAISQPAVLNTAPQPSVHHQPATKPKLFVSKATATASRGVAREKVLDKKLAAKPSAQTEQQSTTTTVSAAAPVSIQQLLEKAHSQAQQRPLSSAELQALTENTIGHPDPHLPKEPQQQNPAHLAKDVLIAFDNGSQLVKVGKDRCVLVIQGADLQKDIQSMKLAPCGRDKNAALFDRIMSQIGQNRAAGDN